MRLMEKLTMDNLHIMFSISDEAYFFANILYRLFNFR